MVTTAGNVGVGEGTRERKPRCFGKYFDSTTPECDVCDFNLNGACKQAMETAEGVGEVEEPQAPEAPEEVEPEEVEPEEVEPEGDDSGDIAGTEEPQAPEEPAPEKKGKVEAPAFDALRVRANTAGAFAIKCLQESWWKIDDLVAKVKEACGGKGTKAHDMIGRAKSQGLLETRGEGKEKEFHIKDAE